jgi:Ca-activated chloride channel family protein
VTPRHEGAGFRATSATAALFLTASGGMAAQTPTFSSAVETVRVDALVTDGHGPIAGLQASDFEVFDDDVTQTVDLVAFQQLPLNVVLALDTSGSVSGERLEALRAASLAVLDELKGEDKAALLVFSNALWVRAGLTAQTERVRAALEEAPVSGDTALIDATYVAMVLGESDAGRALVIVLSDGDDTASFLTPESVLETARRSDVVVYGVSVAGARRTSFLRDLCAQTGGRLLSAGPTKKIGETFLEVLAEFRHRYLLSYVPQGVPKGGWHRLVVRVKKRHANIEARPGYLSGP